MKSSPSFTDVAAVEAWDTWFRWREDGELRDLTIQDTWTRVALALSAVEPSSCATSFARQLVDAMSSWRLLLDETVLVAAGTGTPAWADNELVAALNLAAFVLLPGTPDARMDWDHIEATAGLAVHALDNAMLLAPPSSTESGLHMRIGFVGLADALMLLGERYESDRSRRLGHDMARCLAIGCLRSSLGLANDRGARCKLSSRSTLNYKLRQISSAITEDATRSGLRHARLTAITSQRHLALLANNVTDAIDPAAPGDSPQRYAAKISRHQNAIVTAASALIGDNQPSIAAQMEMRAAMQMWIDQPILYSLLSHPSERAGAAI